jgi:hypothetical protein
MLAVPVRLGELHAGVLVHLQRRRDVEHGDAAHAPAMVARQAMRHPAAAVVANDVEALVAERAHHLGHVLGHRALGIVGVVGQALGLGGIAIAAQVRADNGVVARELRRHLVPHGVGLRIAMQEQHGLAAPAVPEVDGRAAGAQLACGEARKKTHANNSAAATLRSSATRML